jgi:glutamate dehydrogenase/leucine dehydrogenase
MSMAIQVSCDCGRTLSLKNELAGEKIRCPDCGGTIDVPVIAAQADAIFDRRGLVVVPDILVNAGGVTASWFEWVQNRQHYQWGINRVRQELDRILGESFEQVWQLAASRQVTLRTAAYMLGVGRVSRATVLGGIG